MMRSFFLMTCFLALASQSAWAADEAATRGKYVFQRYCLLCHQNPERPDEKQYRMRPGLDLRGIVGSESAIGLGLLDEERLIIWLRNPRKLKPDTKMIRMPLDEGQIRDVVAYLKTLSAPHEMAGAGRGAAKKLVAPPQIRRCHACHDLRPNGRRKVGPPLYGIYGRKPGITGVPFQVWNEEALQKWITDPRAVKPDTTMRFPGMSNPADRLAIIDYLKRLHD